MTTDAVAMSIRILAGLMSRWTIPYECNWARPVATARIINLIIESGMEVGVAEVGAVGGLGGENEGLSVCCESVVLDTASPRALQLSRR